MFRLLYVAADKHILKGCRQTAISRNVERIQQSKRLHLGARREPSVCTAPSGVTLTVALIEYRLRQGLIANSVCVDSGNASEILDDYVAKIGGRESLFGKSSKGKKRGRQSMSAVTPTASTKRARKSGEHPADRETPSVVEKAFKPPAGSWEDDVVDVEMYRNGEGELIVCLTWKAGQKTQHPAQQTYMRCPQKVCQLSSGWTLDLQTELTLFVDAIQILRFYESHISFKTDAD